jgi:septal ring factor EnvC (AmiA/AmiB activator)
MPARRFERIQRLGTALIAAGLLAAPAFADNPAATPATRQPVAQSGMEGAGPDNLAQTAAALTSEIDGLRQQSVSVAEAMRRHEAALSLIESQLQSLSTAAAQKAAALRQDESRRGGLLMALVSLARSPPAALALAAPDPVSAERSALVLATAVPPLDRAARRLHDELQKLTVLRQAIAQAQSQHRTEQAALKGDQQRLADLANSKAALEGKALPSALLSAAAPDPQRLTALANEAASLKDLLQRLDAAEQATRTAPASGAAARPAPVPVAAVAAPGGGGTKLPPLRRFADAAGRYLLPASGRLVQRFGVTKAGITSQGLAYVTRRGAEVVAPYDGRVIFAGPFHGYGHILIVEHADGYDSLIAGLGRIDATVGQWVVSGEPVGTMPEGEDKPRLYLELRHDGQPVNPSPWLATTSQEKVPH